MPWFDYRAATADGELTEGRLDAVDIATAARRLQADGLVPMHIAPTRPASGGRLFAGSPRWLASGPLAWQRGRPGRGELDALTLQLATLLRAGLTLDQALQTLTTLTERPAARQLVETLGEAIRRGSSLSQALAAQDGLFDRFYLNMVRAGEATGSLDLALERLAAFKARSAALRTELLSALIYPAVLVVLAIAAVAVMLAYVVPQFSTLFAEAGRPLPWLTRLVVSTGQLVEAWWWALLLGLTLALYGLYRQWHSPEGRERWEHRLLRLPLAGALIRRLEAARFTRTLATLLGSGVALPDALDIARQTIGNGVIAHRLGSVARRVRQGEGLSRPLAEAAVFPALAGQLVRIGEETGRLEPMLEQLATLYDGEVRTGLARALTLAEPMIILLIAGLITLILLSVILAVLEINTLPF